MWQAKAVEIMSRVEYLQSVINSRNGAASGGGGGAAAVVVSAADGTADVVRAFYDPAHALFVEAVLLDTAEGDFMALEASLRKYKAAESLMRKVRAPTQQQQRAASG